MEMESVKEVRAASQPIVVMSSSMISTDLELKGVAIEPHYRIFPRSPSFAYRLNLSLR